MTFQILPSDKNVVEYFSEIDVKGEFTIQLPLVDENKQKRKISVLNFLTESPFVPRLMTPFYDSLDITDIVAKMKRYYIFEMSGDEFGRDNISVRPDSLLENQNWRNMDAIIKHYQDTGMGFGILGNFYKLKLKLNTFNDKIDQEMDLNNVIQVFAESGRKVTPDELVKGYDVKKLFCEKLKMYYYSVDFLFPLVRQSTSSNSTEFDIGYASMNFDEILMGILRYTLIDFNNGDMRSSVTEFKKSLYLEYDVADPDNPQKMITKYVFIWTLGNPIFLNYRLFHTGDNRLKFQRFRFINTINEKKNLMFGKKGTNVNFICKNENSGDNYQLLLENIFMEMGFQMNTTLGLVNINNNCILNVFRKNWSFVFISALIYAFKCNNNYPVLESNKIGFLLKYFDENPFAYLNSTIDEVAETLPFYYGNFKSVNIPSSKDKVNEIDLKNVESLTLFSGFYLRNNVSAYGPDLVVRVVCDEVENIIYSNDIEGKKLVEVFTFLMANDHTYQLFNDVDNKLIFQPPTFKPLILRQQDQSIIVQSSNKNLHFRLLNCKNEPLVLDANKKVYIKLKVELV